MSDSEQKSDDRPELPSEVRFDFIKANDFRAIHVDGVFGGITPRGKIWASLFSERGAIPTQITHGLKGTRLGDEVMAKRVTRDAIVREVECVLVLDLEVARSMANWLNEKIGIHERAKANNTTPDQDPTA